jgi:hypothetical protein
MSLDHFAAGYTAPKNPHPIPSKIKTSLRKEMKKDEQFRRKMEKLDRLERIQKEDAEYREKRIKEANPKEREALEKKSIPELFRTIEYGVTSGRANGEAVRVDIVKNLLVRNNISLSDRSALQDEWAKLSARKLNAIFNNSKGDESVAIRIYRIIAAKLPY